MNSRWTSNPITRNGHIVATRPNVPGDLEILKWLGRYPLLTANDLVALTNRPYKSVIRRLNKLKRKPNQFIKVCDGQREQPRIYQWTSQALQLAPNGIVKLYEIGFEPRTPKASIHLIHQLTESQVGAAFHALPIITFDAILAAPHTPESAKKSIPVQFTFKGRDYDFDLTPDGEPFGITYKNGTYRFCVFETDCASEPLSSSSADRQSIERKFAAYPHRLRQRPLRDALGLLQSRRALHHHHEASHGEHDRASFHNDDRQETTGLFRLHPLPDHPARQSAGQRMGREAVGTRPRNSHSWRNRWNDCNASRNSSNRS